MQRWMTLLVVALALGCSDPSPNAPSLEGTVPDGALAFEQGRLVLDAGAQQAFDYLILADGELDAAQIEDGFRDRLVRAGVTPAESASALEAFTAYRRYRTQVSEVLADPAGDVASARNRIEQILATELGGTPLASLERERLDRAFAIRRAYDEPDPVIRRAALEALSQEEAHRFRDSRAGAFLEARRAVVGARADGASGDVLHAVRASAFASFGPEAVERLQRVSEARQDFARRIEALAADIDALSSDDPASASTVATWIAERFDEAEQPRVRGALARRAAEIADSAR